MRTGLPPVGGRTENAIHEPFLTQIKMMMTMMMRQHRKADGLPLGPQVTRVSHNAHVLTTTKVHASRCLTLFFKPLPRSFNGNSTLPTNFTITFTFNGKSTTCLALRSRSQDTERLLSWEIHDSLTSASTTETDFSFLISSSQITSARFC